MTDSEKSLPLQRVPLATILRHELVPASRVPGAVNGAVGDAIIRTAKDAGLTIGDSPLLVQALATFELEPPIPIEVFQVIADVMSFAIAINSAGGRESQQPSTA